jgi:sulfur-carrier protein adenylyltransferase/sulfurtransferase
VQGHKDEVDLEISVEKAGELLRHDNRAIVIDTRSNAEVCLGYLKDARFIAPDLIEGQSNRLSADKNVPIIVYCSNGVRSLPVVETLRKMGFGNAQSLAGGFAAWLSEGCEIVTDSKLSRHQINRYSRNMLLKEIGEEGQLRLLDAKVILVGAGGLASSAALYLAACGVGTIGVMDYDRLDLSNLNRQVMHRTEDTHRLKVDSAKEAIHRINPDVRVIPFPERLTPENALSILDGFDVVMDASDNLETKFLLNDACFFAGKPYVFGAAVGFDGQAAVFWPKEGGPCLRCLFPKPPPRHLTPNCSEIGVLGIVPGQIGLVQANEVVKLILKIGTPMIGKFYIYNALTLTMKLLEIGRNPDCPLCGPNPQITCIAAGNYAVHGNDQCQK